MEIAGRLIVNEAQVPESRNVMAYGAVADDSTDNASAILGAINSLSATGGIVYFPPGIYSIDSTIDITKDNVTLEGAGPGATEIHASGDFAAISFTGSSSNNIDRGGVKNMTIRGGGKDNTSAHGIELDYGNRNTFTDLVFFSCRHALDMKDAWQVMIRDCNVYGQGSDQNYIGLYGQVSANSASNNALVVNNLNVQSTESHGVRMETFGGSKFTNCEVGTTGEKGWFFGNPQSGGPYLKFLHVANCLSDTCTNEAWFFDGTGGYGNYIADIQLANIWAGSATEGIHIEDAYNFTVSNILVETMSGHGIFVENGDRIDFHGGYVDNYDSEDTSTYSGFYLQDSDKCLVSGFNFVADGAESAIREAGSSDYNRILGNHTADGGGINTIGGNTVEDNNIT